MCVYVCVYDDTQVIVLLSILNPLVELTVESLPCKH